MFLKSSPLRSWQTQVSAASLFISATGVHALPPEWWSTGSPPVISSSPESNKGLANVGQAKWVARNALRTLEEHLGAGSATVTAIKAELYKTTETDPDGVFFPTRPATPTQEWLNAQRAPLQIGALKALAAPFYKHLSTLDDEWVKGHLEENGLVLGSSFFQDTDGTYYPWNPADDSDTTKNRSTANIGQLKSVFSLRLPYVSASGDSDSDNDGLWDEWELLYFGGLSHTASGDSDGNGITNLQSYQQGLDPWVADVDEDGLSARDEAALGLNLNVDESAPGSGVQTEYDYDATGRVVDVESPQMDTTFTHDDEGNISIAQ